MIFKSIEVSNLFSFGNREYVEFPEEGNILIFGVNEDSPGMSSNGAGKSSLLDTLSWIDYGESARKGLSVEEVIRHGQNKAEGTVELLDAEGRCIRTTRSRLRSGKADLSLWIDGEEKTSLKGPTATQAILERYLGFDRRTFLNAFYLSAFAHQVFSETSDSADRIKFVEELLGLDIYRRALKRARERLRERERDEASVEGELSALKGLFEGKSGTQLKEGVLTKEILCKKKKTVVVGLERQLDEAREVRGCQDKVLVLKRRAETAESREQQAKKYVDKAKSRVREIEAELKKKPVLEKELSEEKKKGKMIVEAVGDLRNKMKKKQVAKSLLVGERSRFETRLDENDEKRRSVEKVLVGKATTCPLCATKITKDKAEHLRKEIDKLGLQKDDLKTSFADVEDKFDSVENGIRVLENEIGKKTNEEALAQIVVDKKSSKLSYLSAKDDELKKAKKQLKDFRSELVVVGEDLEQVREEYRKKEKELEKFGKGKDVDFSVLQNELDEAREEHSEASNELAVAKKARSDFLSYKKKRKELKGSLEQVRKDTSQLAFWVEGFSGIRAWVVGSFVPDFELRTNRCLEALGAPMRVRFDVDYQKTKFEMSISDGRNVQSWNLWSSGERKRVFLAQSIALRQALIGSDSGFMLFDEVADSLDEAGVEAFVQFLNGVKGQKFIISHSLSLKKAFERVGASCYSLCVRKRNGVSRIELN